MALLSPAEAMKMPAAELPAAELPTHLIPHLLKPVVLGGVELRNRCIMAAMTRGRSGESRLMDDTHAQYYAARATYAGMIVCEGAHPSLDSVGWVGSPLLFNEQHAAGWKKVVDAVHAKGCKMVAQIWNQGRAGHSSFMPDGGPPYAPSAIKIAGESGLRDANDAKVEYEVPREMTLAQIKASIAAHKQAAVAAKLAGFDGIELHCANGYLNNEFMESSSNTRTDAYGGSVENRFRIVAETLDAICQVYPSNKVAVKLSPNGAYNGMGSPDNGKLYDYVLAELSKRDLMYVCVMDGLAFGFHQKCAVYTIEMVRKAYSGKLVANCGYDDKTAEAVIASGNADAVEFARPFIANPDLPYRYAMGLPLAESDAKTWYTHGPEGYNDYPALEQ
ncbi:hypothetical protein FOA52_008063 [Chlamydomonas sp. UWO 241]|nr:hypothetical protein FOA52_008063 [Chlamydomonas sp. UWO 241]